MSTAESHPPIDPELEAVMPAIMESGLTWMNMPADQIPRARELFAAGLPSDDFLRHGGTVEMDERSIPGPEGAPELPALILRPAGRTGRLPCIYYTANGGKILRSTRLALTDVELDWVAQLGVVMISVAARVGPEDPHPAQIDDAYAGLVWVADHADELGIDPDHIMVFGKSGGGGVAAATALMARDQGGPPLTHQILIYPMIDDREQTVSSKFEGVLWDRATNRTGWSAILGDTCGGPDVSPYAAAARATDLSGLPPAYLETGSSEVFRDEIIDYAARLAQTGVPMELHSWVGGFHGFELVAPDAEVSRVALAARTSYLRRALASVKTAAAIPPA
jgi:acetyl esterase/lipase